VTSPTIFIGLITHENSQYLDSQSETGLAQSLGRELSKPECRPNVVALRIQVISDNLFGDNTEGLSEKDSLRAELRVEREWARYLNRPDKRDAWLTRQKRKVRYLTRSPKYWSASHVTRLLNIEYSHRALWQEGLDSGADWILILEDDAHCSDPADLARGIAALVNVAMAGQKVSYINLSASFTSTQLGVKHLLKVSTTFKWQGLAQRVVFTCTKPVTNTVCALMYSRHYLYEFVPVWDSLPMSPVLPIDWKMNQAIMTMQADPRSDLGETLWIEPAPILQRSMHMVKV